MSSLLSESSLSQAACAWIGSLLPLERPDLEGLELLRTSEVDAWIPGMLTPTCFRNYHHGQAIWVYSSLLSAAFQRYW